MGFAREAEALAAISAAQGQRAKAKLRAMLNGKLYRAKVQAYAECFLGPDGELTKAGAYVVGDLAKVAKMGTAKEGQSADAVREDMGARRVVLHLIEFLREDPAKLRRMARQIRELDND